MFKLIQQMKKKKYFFFTAAVIWLIFIIAFSLNFKTINRKKSEVYAVEWSYQKSTEYIETPVAKSNTKKKGRFPAAAGVGPRFIIEDGMKKLVIELKYVCSSWLYLGFGNNVVSPLSLTNYCRDYAAGSTAVANMIYRNSKIPVFFEYTFNFDADLTHLMTKPEYSLTEYPRLFENTTDPARFSQVLNNNSSNTNPLIMPAIRLISFPVTRKTGAKTPKVDLNSCSWAPGWDLTSKVIRTSCPLDKNSTVVVNNFSAFWGREVPKYRCGAEPNCAFGKSGNPSLDAPIQTMIYTNGTCFYSCECVHYQNNSTLWGQNVWRGSSGFYSCSNSFGTFPGPPQALSGRNACGCIVNTITGQDYFASNSSSLFPTSDQYFVTSEDSTFNWLNKTRDSNPNFMAQTDEFKIVIAVRPFADTFDVYPAAGIAPIIDLDESFAFAPLGLGLPGGGGKMAIDLRNFFKNFGAVVVNLDYPAMIAVAHEVGHIFGARHNLDTYDSSRNQEVPVEKLRARNLGAYYDPNGFYNTVMGNTPVKTINYFSTRSFKDQNGLLLGKVEDNRQQVVKTISALSGQKLETVQSPETISVVLNILSEIFGLDLDFK